MIDDVYQFLNLTQDEIEDAINVFIDSNSNEEGIDSSKVYLANLRNIVQRQSIPIYSESSLFPEGYQSNFGINCPINKTNDYNKPTIVFILKSQSDRDHVFIDIFNKTLLQSTFLKIDGLFSLLPIIREGVTVNAYYPLNEICKLDRISYEELKYIYNIISK